MIPSLRTVSVASISPQAPKQPRAWYGRRDLTRIFSYDPLACRSCSASWSVQDYDSCTRSTSRQYSSTPTRLSKQCDGELLTRAGGSTSTPKRSIGGAICANRSSRPPPPTSEIRITGGLSREMRRPGRQWHGGICWRIFGPLHTSSMTLPDPS